ncbi:MAG: hypothetical protein ACE366_24045 [Bradymonadia bacterium]
MKLFAPPLPSEVRTRPRALVSIMVVAFVLLPPVISALARA